MGLPTLHQINILGTCLGAFAATVTLWRLFYRWRSQKLWYDDAWALAAMVNGLIPVGCVWVIFAPEGSNVTQHARVVCFYLLEVAFTFTIWSARLSILYTIIRITPERAMRRILYGIVILFVTFALVLAAQKFWVCVPQPGWTTTPGAVCNLGKQVAVTEIVTDVIGDIILIAIPIKLLWNIKITRALRLRLFVVFSMSILTTIVSLAQNYYLIHDGGVIDFIVSHVELQTAVTVCNLNVLIAAIYRFIHRKELEETGHINHKYPTTNTFHSRRVTTQPIRSTGTTTDDLHVGGGRLNGGIRVHTETIQWAVNDPTKTNGVSEEEDYEDGSVYKIGKNVGDEEQEHEFDAERGVGRGDTFRMNNLTRH